MSLSLIMSRSGDEPRRGRCRQVVEADHHETITVPARGPSARRRARWRTPCQAVDGVPAGSQREARGDEEGRGDRERDGRAQRQAAWRDRVENGSSSSATPASPGAAGSPRSRRPSPHRHRPERRPRPPAAALALALVNRPFTRTPAADREPRPREQRRPEVVATDVRVLVQAREGARDERGRAGQQRVAREAEGCDEQRGAPGARRGRPSCATAKRARSAMRSPRPEACTSPWNWRARTMSQKPFDVSGLP